MKRILVIALAGVLLPLSFNGCASQRFDKGKYVREGVPYGTTRGQFRGRWWNYYERGRSFLEGEFYDEAEADLRAALAARKRDQLWPRTYGMHFTPEYFPNRELGISNYYQGNIPEALRYLEGSLGDQYSARAAYFVKEARKRELESSGRDQSSPTIEIIAPDGAIPVGATQVEVRGIARDDTYIGAIIVGGVDFDVKLSMPEVPFSHMVTLAPGQNEIAIVATDLLGKTATTVASIKSDVDGPLVSFDEPVVIPGAVRGVVYDPAQVMEFVLNGQAVSLTPGEGGAQAFSVDIARTEVDAPITYEAKDALGNFTRGTVAPNAVEVSAREAERLMGGARFASFGRRGVEIAPGVEIVHIEDRIFAVAAAEAGTDGLSAELTNFEEGQVVYQDEIVVGLKVRSDEPLLQVALNDKEVETIPGRSRLETSRLVRLEQGPNQMTMLASTQSGKSTQAQKALQRDPSEIEMNKNKLSVAFLREASSADLLFGGEQILDYTMQGLEENEVIGDRFQVVNRSLLPQSLQELQLSSELSSGIVKLDATSLKAAEVLLQAAIRGEQGNLEIVLRGTSTETLTLVAPRVDVAGPSDKVDDLITLLGVRLSQEFPKAKGIVIEWSGGEISSDISESAGIRQDLKWLVYQEKELMHPTTGKSLGPKAEVICQGLINQVASGFSSAKAFPIEEGGDIASLPIEVGQSVIMK